MSERKLTQTERVIAAARSFQGTCQADFLGDTVDGLPIITRVGARIQDAEERGYAFEIIGWRNKTRIYRLVSEPDADGDCGGEPPGSAPIATATSPELDQAPAATVSVGLQGDLFAGIERRKGQLGYGEEEAA